MDTKPLFRFFLWNDLHVDAARYFNPDTQEGIGTFHYPFANEKAMWAVECATGQHGFKKPEFIVSAGDIINGGNSQSKTGEDFAYFESSLPAKLRLPFLPCVGNHENAHGSRPYDECFGELRQNYVFTYGGVAFIVVDTSKCPGCAENDFLCRAFEQFGKMPVLVVTHVPLIAMRQEEVLKKSFFPTFYRVESGMLEIVESHSDSVIAVLCGHIHLTAIRKKKGVYHIMPAGTAGYPCDFAAFECFPDKMIVRMHKAPANWVRPDHLGDIHGKPRWEIDYVDDLHRDHESYVLGNPDERFLTIPLPSGKQIIRGTKKLEVFHEVEPDKWEKSEFNRSQEND